MRKSSRRPLIFFRMVLAAYSCLSDASHVGTTLCASTSFTGTSTGHSSVLTDSLQSRPIRNGEKSVTSMEHPSFSAMDGTVTPGSGPVARWNGMPRLPSVDSSSLSPRSMKQYCLAPALANSGTSAKTTWSGLRCSRATARAWQSAQLSIALWSRDIQ